MQKTTDFTNYLQSILDFLCHSKLSVIVIL